MNENIEKYAEGKEVESMEGKFVFDSTDYYGLVDLMNKYGNEDELFEGKNEDGEQMLISIYPDKIIVTVFQNNHWVRVSTYYRDGESDETFDGKW